MKSRDSLIRLTKFQVDEKRRQLAQIEMMVADCERMAGELDEQIVIEQNKVGITDVNHYAYPTFAKAAVQRRDNLKTSIADLQVQMDAAKDDLAAAIEELKKYELMAERDKARVQSQLDDAEQVELDEIASQVALR
jgi:flagellar export protein FliJ